MSVRENTSEDARENVSENASKNASKNAETPALEARLTIAVGSGPAAFSVRAEVALESGILILFGPSGAGKTLTLRALAGLIRPAEGFLRVGGETLFDSARRVFVPAHKRRIGYVPQHASLFPFLSVAENASFGLPRAERRRGDAVLPLLEELGLTALAGARAHSLSGGERQRVALARALAVKPRLLLLDEPFASIDRDGRAALRRTLRAVLASRRTPAVFVTHDPEEARELGDSLVLFERGRTTAMGPPASLLGHRRPVVVTGELAGPPAPLPDGRAAFTVREAIIEGPADLLDAPALNRHRDARAAEDPHDEDTKRIRLDLFERPERK